MVWYHPAAVNAHLCQVMQHTLKCFLPCMKAGKYQEKSHLLVILHNCQDCVNCVQDAHGHNRFVLYFLIFLTLKYFTKYFSLWTKPTNLTFKSKPVFLICHSKPRQLMQQQQCLISKSCQHWKICWLLLKGEHSKLKSPLFFSEVDVKSFEMLNS